MKIIFRNICCIAFLLFVFVLLSGLVSAQAQTSFTFTPRPNTTVTKPQVSGPIYTDELNNKVWVVNPDTNTVARLSDTTPPVRDFEKAVGQNPRTLAQAPDGSIWVVNQDSATISVLDYQTGDILATINLPRASQPFGIVFSPDGQAAYVSLAATGQLAKLSPTSRTLLSQVSANVPTPRGLAITADSQSLFVTRFISSPGPTGQGEIAQFSLATGSPVFQRILPLVKDPGPDTSTSGRGVPNYVMNLAISPNGQTLWYSGNKDNVDIGTFRSTTPSNPQNTVRTIAGRLDLTAQVPTETIATRIDLDDRDFISAIKLSNLGDYVFLAVQGHGTVQVRQVSDRSLVTEFMVGQAPQGLSLSADGNRLFVQNFLSRNVSVYNVTAIVNSTGTTATKIADVATITTETLPPPILRGKQIFYRAADPRMNSNGYLTCASCHLEGGSDGQVWDFTERGEGLRNTTTLKGKGGVAQGRAHWTGNFDEIQDFENDIRNFQGGQGFLTNAQWTSGTRNQPLGDPKRGLSPDLDDLAAYVTSLVIASPSPYRNSDGTMTASALAGKAIFQAKNCASCHNGTSLTDSQVGANSPLHDVGTNQNPGAGKRLGGTLTGFDTPTLLGVWETAPYMHDGSLATLLDVVNAAAADSQQRHGQLAGLSATEKQQLVDYMLQTDSSDSIVVSALRVNDPANRVSWYLQDNLATGQRAYGDITDTGYTIQYVPPVVNGLRWISPAKASSSYSANPLLQFNLNKAGAVYLAVNEAPAWLATNGWLDSGQLLTLKDGASQFVPLKLYWKTFPAGPVSFDAAYNSSFLYFVIVSPDSQTPCNPLIVTSPSDNTTCGTLRSALSLANTQAGLGLLSSSYVITFTPGLSQITLGSNLPAILPGVVIQASCANPVTLNGGGASGLTLNGNVWLEGLRLTGFSGPVLALKSSPTGPNKLLCLKVN